MTVRMEWSGDQVKAQLTAQAVEAKRALAELLAERTAQLCPVDTGDLRSSIAIVTANTDDAFVVVVRQYYAFYVEFGHRTTQGGWVPGQYFMTRALVEVGEAAPEVVTRVFTHGSANTDNTVWQMGVDI